MLHVVHFNVSRDWSETNPRHQKRFSKGGKKKIGRCRSLLGKVTVPFASLMVVLKMWQLSRRLAQRT